MHEARSIINPNGLDIDNELLYVDRNRYYSGTLHNATPLFAKAILGTTILVVNVAELDDESIRIWYQHHKNAALQMPEIITRTLCNLHTLKHECEAAKSLMHTYHSSSGPRDPLPI